MAKLHIQWKKSAIGYSSKQGRIIRALGLRRLNQEVEHEDTASILGMVQKVRHLVKVRRGEE